MLFQVGIIYFNGFLFCTAISILLEFLSIEIGTLRIQLNLFLPEKFRSEFGSSSQTFIRGRGRAQMPFTSSPPPPSPDFFEFREALASKNKKESWGEFSSQRCRDCRFPRNVLLLLPPLPLPSKLQSGRSIAENSCEGGRGEGGSLKKTLRFSFFLRKEKEGLETRGREGGGGGERREKRLAAA